MCLRTSWWLRGGLIIYSALAAWQLFTGGPLPIPGGYGAMYNFVPGRTISESLTVGNSDAKFLLVLNVLMLIPIGVFMAMERVRPRLAIFGIILISLLIETVQYLVPRARSADVDDLILNSIGGIVAYWLLRSLLHRHLLNPVPVGSTSTPGASSPGE